MIKNYFSLFAFIGVIMLSNICHAQLFNRSLHPYWIIYDDETNGQDPKKFMFSFKEMTVKTGKKSERHVYNYDKEGRVTSYLTEKTKQSPKNKGFVVSYQSESKKLINKVVTFKNQVVFKYDSANYNSYDKLVYYHTADKNGNLKTKDLYQYDSTLIIKHENFNFKNSQPRLRNMQIYEYESDKRIKKITYYNKKRKAYKNTLFDCNPMGINHKIRKDSAYMCVKYDTDSLGNKMEITIENVKNRSSKVIRYFNSQNKMIAQKNFDLKKDWPTSFIFYNAETGTIVKFIYFHKGKEDYKRETTMDDKNNIVEIVTYRKNKPTSFFKNEFTKEGLVTVSKGYNRKHKLVRTVTYDYGLK